MNRSKKIFAWALPALLIAWVTLAIAPQDKPRSSPSSTATETVTENSSETAPDKGAGHDGHTGEPNRLIHETSPYLQLHAYNPVDWYPWGTEALERARRENKPIFLSVGYTTCYWCHVMEREVFSNPEIAALMNQWFVNIKVDREERPELDEIYMTATQLMTRHGGWPNSVFLTPDLKPFFAGTYFPPTDGRGRPGFPRVLEGLNQAWTDRRQDVVQQANRIAVAMEQTLAANADSTTDLPKKSDVVKAASQLKRVYDEEFGGFGSGHKFPSPSNLYYLWQQGQNGDNEAERLVLETLAHMGRGAIYDQLDGGFHRYTLDPAWRIPHFEKMLYDNAHLGELLAITSAATKDPELERLARGTFDFVLQWMTLPNGAFKSAIDAETDAIEGAYYIWTRPEIEEVLTSEEYALVGPIFGFEADPNFEESHYTLHLKGSFSEHAARLDISRDELLRRLEPALEKLRKTRGLREFPIVDDKVLSDWNGMMISALARGGDLLNEPRYVEAAARAADFVLTLRNDSGTQLHVWRDGTAKIPAFLDDYAFLIRGLLALEEVTDDKKWLQQAIRLADQLEDRLAAPQGGYFMSEDRPDVLIRSRAASDGAIPSGNGVAALDLLTLAERTGEERFRTRAEALLSGFGEELAQRPRSVLTLAQAAIQYLNGPQTTRAVVDAKPTPVPSMLPLDSLAMELVEANLTLADQAADDEWRGFVLEVAIRRGWHINANPASMKFLIPTQVDGDVRALSYPPGESFKFEFADDAIDVYSGLTKIRGEVASTAQTLELEYQACDDRRCLPPVTKSLPFD